MTAASKVVPFAIIGVALAVVAGFLFVPVTSNLAADEYVALGDEHYAEKVIDLAQSESLIDDGRFWYYQYHPQYEYQANDGIWQSSDFVQGESLRNDGRIWYYPQSVQNGYQINDGTIWYNPTVVVYLKGEMAGFLDLADGIYTPISDLEAKRVYAVQAENQLDGIVIDGKTIYQNQERYANAGTFAPSFYYVPAQEGEYYDYYSYGMRYVPATGLVLQLNDIKETTRVIDGMPTGIKILAGDGFKIEARIAAPIAEYEWAVVEYHPDIYFDFDTKKDKLEEMFGYDINLVDLEKESDSYDRVLVTASK